MTKHFNSISDSDLYDTVLTYKVNKQSGNGRLDSNSEVINSEKYEKASIIEREDTSMITLRMSAYELETLKKTAKAEGMTVSRWVAEKAAQYEHAL